MAGDSTVNPGNFASVLLGRMGLPTTSPYQAIINTWLHAESGSSSSGNPGWEYNNPLNASCYDWDTNKIGCWTAQGGHRFAIYPNLNAAVDTYVGSGFLGSGPYKAIINAKSPLQLANAISGSPWDAAHYSGHVYGGQKGIAALALQNGYITPTALGAPGAAPTGITGGSSNPPASTSSSGGSPLDAVTGIPGAIIGFLGGTIQSVIFDGMAILLGLIFVVVGLIMFLKGTSSPVEGVRAGANMAVDAGLAAAAPEGVVSARSFGRAAGSYYSKKAKAKPGYASGAGIRVEDIVHDEAPASFSSETPRALVVLPEIRQRQKRPPMKNVTPREGRLTSGERGLTVGPKRGLSRVS